ncbi:NAD(P)-dependent oxidoreductase [Marinococcus luteus]|uniref:NAD(P)-dependent oxidoreductase n=1 Tax=Marinococcus luteus TaxID=1122204 RepID=UPI002ACCEC46|nr:NAD(P)-dependent oxidoreductase [Marinococcus luteus]MDZ5784373.1 NAD(P)-dependent oxidoreductase [Marinococcus luteus]
MSNHRSDAWISTEQLQENFAEVNSPLTTTHAVKESNRCLFCYDAPCIQACPTGIDIPAFIKKIASGNLKGSAVTIMDANPVGASCARVCPTEELCEGACVLNGESEPIMIGDLQRYATDWAIRNEQVLFEAGPSTSKHIAIVGSGPAGLAAARELARFGHQVTIFEADDEPGGLNRYGIVSFRLPVDIVKWEIDQIVNMGVTIRTNTTVGIDVTPEDLREQFDSIIIAVGMGSVPELHMEGEDASGVYDAVDFVRSTKEGTFSSNLAGKRVAVIGAGNTAVDAATCSTRLGAEHVSIVYRRTKNEMTAYPFEFEFAKQDGIAFQWLTSPVKIEKNANGEVDGLECVQMELGEADQDGRQRPVPIQNSNFMMDVDVVIRAIGQERLQDTIAMFGLDHTDGVVTVDASYAASEPNHFAVGDVIFGSGQGEAMVVSAAEQGKQAAYTIHQQLSAGTQAAG